MFNFSYGKKTGRKSVWLLFFYFLWRKKHKESIGAKNWFLPIFNQARHRNEENNYGKRKTSTYPALFHNRNVSIYISFYYFQSKFIFCRCFKNKRFTAIMSRHSISQAVEDICQALISVLKDYISVRKINNF